MKMKSMKEEKLMIKAPSVVYDLKEMILKNHDEGHKNKKQSILSKETLPIDSTIINIPMIFCLSKSSP